MAESAPASSLASSLKGQRIGRILTKMGKCTRDQVHKALEVQKQKRAPLGQIMIEMGVVKQEDVTAALAAQAGYEAVDLLTTEISDEAIKMLPAETAMTCGVLPIKYDKASRTLTVALKNPENLRAIDDLRLLMGFKVIGVVADTSVVEKLMQKYYAGKSEEESLTNLVGELASDTKLAKLKDRGESIDLESVTEAMDDNKVKRLLSLVLLQAIKDRASDVHFEPFEDEFKMRYRIDGVLYEMVPPPKYLAMPIVSRIKVMANLDIAERRVPQDGRIVLQVGGSPVDLRVAILPTMFGESVVMRVLDRSSVQLKLDKLGLRHEDLELVRILINKPNGIVIVTGPTGSGKTTTLYAALSELNQVDTKIVTVEDPVEYDIEGLVQVPVNAEVGLTFGKALRSFLRQDPDIILVGETRDIETAQISVQASLTGHLVFTTLHTNDAPSSIARLLDLGLESFLVTATLEGIVAQRLVRKICTRCKEEYSPTEEQLMELQLTLDDLQGRKLYRGKGCEYCNHSGYKGRLGLYEIMTIDDDMRDLIMRNASTQLLRAEALKRGMRTLRQAGLLAIFDGITTLDEVVRETIMED